MKALAKERQRRYESPIGFPKTSNGFSTTSRQRRPADGGLSVQKVCPAESAAGGRGIACALALVGGII